ncbi:LamG domain-containing protein [Bacteroides sp. 51]|uniref:LamG domain-containing protein n=1 Tax=Bacteroides sp. 51 TaxID=2302938 RepID=UPI0013D6624C|nr:LamG domain-containing protein [Bacteroides sp. 51]NDV82082.1 LamG domain-containing protein [Bacteroides sp. 51]
MKLKRYILFSTVCIALMGMTSCFQDMDQDPAFDYPPEYVPEESPLKVYIPFEDKDKNMSNYRYSITTINEDYIDGHIGKAFQGSDGAYIIATPPASLTEAIVNLGSFTYSFWMNSPRNEAVQGILSIAKKDHSRGYLELYFENNNNGNQAYIKGFMRTVPKEGNPKETWIDVGSVQPEGSSRVENVWNKWTHLAFRYDGSTSTISIFRDGEAVLLNRVLGGGTFGPLAFDPAFCDGKIVFGAFAAVAGQSTGKQDAWVVNSKTMSGQYDQIRFYNQALSDNEIKALYTSKE